MFLQHAKFKKLLKDAAKGRGFLMAYDKEGYYLEGSWWRAYIDQSTMDKETKSVIIAVSGEFPNTASFRVLKEYNQYTMKEPEDIQKYKEMPEDCRELKDTKLEITSLMENLHLYAGEKGIVAVNGRITEMLSYKTACDTEDDYPYDPTLSPDGNEIFWCSDKMIFSCMRIVTEREDLKKFTTYLEGFDF